MLGRGPGDGKRGPAAAARLVHSLPDALKAGAEVRTHMNGCTVRTPKAECARWLTDACAAETARAA